MKRTVLGLVMGALCAACGPQPSTGGTTSSSSGEQGLVDAGEQLPPDAGYEPGWQIGRGDHSAGSVTLTVIAQASDGLRRPRDLQFHNSREDELWIVNRQDDSTVTVYAATTPERNAVKKIDAFALHFMEEVSSMAFGKPDQFATCQESRNTYNGQSPQPNDFMGPALWTADPAIYAVVDPEGLGSHLDMLHESPLCMGIAHVQDNIFWVFDGMDGALVYYDFAEDHGAGYDDHSDGVILRYASGEVLRVADVPSHMVFNADNNHLYVADTGHSRVLKFDTSSGTSGPLLPAKEQGTVHRRYTGAVLTDVVTAASGDVSKPSGLELHDGLIWVSDNENGRISAFTMEGTRVNYLDTGLPTGSLMGMTFGPDGRLYFVDAVGNQVLRVEP